MQTLPTGIQHFRRLRAKNALYVDKTELVHRLINTGDFVFLARPRRFGKSLLVTLLKELFEGHQTLFEGLWIEDKIDWRPRPVILINFNDIDYLEQSLSTALTEYMDKLAKGHGITLEEDDYKGKFQELIVTLSQQIENQDIGVVLLVDEYDKPITDFLGDQAKVQEHVRVLKNFYSVLKATESSHLHFTFLTGVSKYGKISIFSDLNNLIDITLAPQFSTLLGYTEGELTTYFGDHLADVASTMNIETEQLLAQIKRWYDGYSWDGQNRVYVPFSTLLFFQQKTFANHWFSTATPSFLVELLRQKVLPAYELENIGGGSALMDSADVEQLDIIPLLFHTGYLTVKASHRSSLTGETRYRLGYPNFEVANAFQRHLLADYLAKPLSQITGTSLDKLETALATQDIDGFISVLKLVFSQIPYKLFLDEEAYYHSVAYLTLKVMGFEIYAELLTNVGRIDAVLSTDDTVYIIEFKMTTAKAALKQIKDKQYAQPFMNQGKTIILLGIAFDKEKRNISDWKPEIIKQ
ncbi:MAG: ATP-binding protein [Chloroflexota bacterium]